MKTRKGFTLLEIMVTVGIIGVLASMATYAVMIGHKKAKIRQAEGELQMLATATLQLAWDTSRWPNKTLRTQPGSDEVWNLSRGAVGLMATDGTYSQWKGPYYSGNILDPWGHPYFFDPDYLINGVNHIVVGSFGPNGVGPNVYDKDDIYVLLDD